MYAIVDILGHQFKVAKDDKIVAYRVDGEEGSEVEFDRVVLLTSDDGTKVGTPYVDGAKVTATIVDHHQAKKVTVFKKKRRKTYQVKNGHRQPMTTLQIKEIVA